jgi:hypothetical protein
LNCHKELKGWSKHQHFGLRQEWLELYLNHPKDWDRSGQLGNRQVDSLRVWLKTTGLLDKNGNETFLCGLFRKKGLDNLLGWELLWINVVFRFATAQWYVRELRQGAWTTTEIANILHQQYPHLAKHTITNGVMEIVGLLERTPVGKELNQGEVMSSCRPRKVNRERLSAPSTEAVFYALCQLLLLNQRNTLSFQESCLWPWIIFGCEQKYVFQKIIIDGESWFMLNEQTISLKVTSSETEYLNSMPNITTRLRYISIG